MSKPLAVDLFAGAGGFSLGAEMAGVEIEQAVEIDSWASDTLRKNHDGTQVTTADITTLSDQWIRRNLRRNPDFVIGGPPCQGFSHAGPAKKDPKDPRNSLFREFLRVVRLLDPECAIIENVPGLVRAHTASGEPVPEAITSEFARLGYTTSVFVLDAHLYGVPQIRRRVFFVASQSFGQIAPPEPTHADFGDEISLFGLPSPLTVRDAIGDLPLVNVGDCSDALPYVSSPQNSFQRLLRKGAGPLVRNHQPMRHTARLIERFKQIKPGQSQSDVSAEHAPRVRVRGKESCGVYDQNNRRMFWDRPCHTIAASFYANFVHPELHRNFTPREGARIQSFPDRYVFEGKATVVSARLLAREGRDAERHLSQYNQIGNAVPPFLSRVVVAHVLSARNRRSGMARQTRPDLAAAV